MRICLCACECHLFYNTSGAVTTPPPMVTAGDGTESSVSLFNIIGISQLQIKLLSQHKLHICLIYIGYLNLFIPLHTSLLSFLSFLSYMLAPCTFTRLSTCMQSLGSQLVNANSSALHAQLLYYRLHADTH